MLQTLPNGSLQFESPQLPHQLIDLDSLWSQVTATTSYDVSTKLNSFSATDSDSFLIKLLCIHNDSPWQIVHEMISHSLCDGSNANKRPVILFDSFLSVFSSLNQVIARSLQFSLLGEIISASHDSQQLVEDLVRVCWCGVRMRFPRLSDLQMLFTQMSLSESILIAEICIQTMRSKPISNETDTFIPSYLGSVSDFVFACVTNWEARGIFDRDQLIPLPSCISSDSATQLDSTLALIRCHWVAILYLRGVRKQSLGSGM